MTRQFDVVVNKTDKKGSVPYFIVLQHRFIDSAHTVVVAPLHRVQSAENINVKLCPAISVVGIIHYCLIYQLAAIPRILLGQVVSNAEDYRDDIIRAFDIIVSGI